MCAASPSRVQSYTPLVAAIPMICLLCLGVCAIIALLVLSRRSRQTQLLGVPIPAPDLAAATQINHPLNIIR